jgi:cytochrome P450
VTLAADGSVDFEALAELRRQGGVCPLGSGGWLVVGHDALVEALKDVGSFRADLSFGVPDIPDELLFLSEIPEPRHGRVRRIYNAQLGPHRLAEAEPFIRALCTGLLDRLVSGHEVDLVAGYTSQIPSGVIAHVIGVPAEDADRFVAWSNDGLMLGRDAETPFLTYISHLMAVRRAMADPPDDVIGALLAAEVEGAPLSDAEIRTQIQFIVASAVDTTRKLLANLLSWLLFHPDLYRRLRVDRALVPVAVEETLRLLAPVQTVPRKCTRPTELDGVDIAPGQVVMIGIGSANRDERVFEDPDRFSLDRPNPRNHVGFGAGPHICPGASLARLEATVAMELFVDRVAELQPVPGATYEPVPTPELKLPRALRARLVPA